MANFAEEMVYWYLRLNGFFVLQNFVLHHQDLDDSQNADVDLLAIRQLHTYEAVGGQHFDNDKVLFSHFDSGKTIAIICEVKSGRDVPTENQISLNQPDRLSYALQRIGFFPRVEIESMHLPNLRKGIITNDNYHQVLKLLVTQRPVQYHSCACLTLEHVDCFLRNHLRNHIDAKSGARLFFQSELLQHLVWSINQEENIRRRRRTEVPSTETSW